MFKNLLRFLLKPTMLEFGDLYTESEKVDKDDIDINDDKQIEVIKDLKTDEEIEAAKQVIDEELEELSKESTSAKKPEEPKPTKEEKAKGTSDGDEDKTKAAQDKKTEESAEKKPSEDFVLTEDKINSYPEEVRGLLSKYKDKNKAELAKASAHAVAFSTPYLKGNEEAIAALVKQFEKLSEADLIKTLTDTQKSTSKNVLHEGKMPKTEELPPLPEDNEEVNKAIAQETVKRLRGTKYPNMPENLNSEEGKAWLNQMSLIKLREKYGNVPADPTSIEYQEYLRDMQDENFEKVNEFILDKREAMRDLQNEFNNAASTVKKDMQQLIYVQNNYQAINNTALQKEVGLINQELNQLGLSDKDLGMDFKLEPDDKGFLYNEFLSPLLLNGERPDPNIISFIGIYPLFNKPGQLKNKFLANNTVKLLNLLSSKRVKENHEEAERLRDTNLNSLGGSKSSGTNGDVLTIDQIEKTTNSDALKKMKAKLDAQFE